MEQYFCCRLQCLFNDTDVFSCTKQLDNITPNGECASYTSIAEIERERLRLLDVNM